MTEPTLCAICHQPAHRYGIPDPEHEYDAMGCVNMLLPALDLERNRTDEAERKVVAYAKNAYVHIQRAGKAEAEVERLRAVVEAAKHQRDTWNDYMNGDKAALVESVMESQMRTAQALAALAAPPDPKEPSEPREATLHEKVAWLMWCFDQGYVKAEDRAILDNWFAEDVRLLSDDDMKLRPGLLEMAGELIAAIRTETGIGKSGDKP